MKRLSLILLMSVLLVSCNQKSVDEQFEECILLLDKSEECNVEDVEDLATIKIESLLLGLEGYSNLAQWESSSRMHSGFDGDMTLVVNIVSKKTFFDLSSYNDIMKLTDEIYDMVNLYGLQGEFSIVVILNNMNPLGNDTLRIEKSSNEMENDIFLYYYHDSLTLNTVEEQKDIIDRIFEDSDDFRFNYAYVCVDPDIEEWNKRSVSFALEYDVESEYIRYRLFDSGSDVVLSITPEELYQSLFDTYPEVTFEYLD